MEIKLKRAVELHRQGNPEQAGALYADILRAQPGHPDALHLLGVTETQAGRAESGLAWIAKSLAANPHQPVAIANQGNAYLALNRPGEALASYERSLQLAPDYPLALFGRGNALAALGRPAEALSSFEGALRAAPEFAQAHLGRGRALLALGRHAEALRSIDHALSLKPDHAEAHLERGHVLAEQRDLAAAIGAYDRALGCNSALAAAWFGRALAVSLLGNHAEAAESFQRALEIDPSHPYSRGAKLHAQLQIADWTDHAASAAAIVARLERDERVDFPFSFLAVCDSAALQLRCARQFAALQAVPASRSASAPRSTAHGSPRERIRIGYISADFLEHPTSYLLAGLIERHDRRRFETIGISLREDTESPTARRVQAAFERWIAPDRRSDEDLARLIGDLQLDIAIDLMGYTGEHRAGLFAHRPAPIQATYLGYPGTTGSPHVDYLIADEFLIPEDRQSHYSERIAYLPECFQANDDRRVAAAEAPTREQVRLPAAAFVFASFHGTYKLNPPLFDVWARLLLAVPGSVLWLLGGKAAEDNLRAEAAARGVDSERLVFAQPEPYPRHLARLPLADLCLDTYPFNGGATTSDALWAGVPVVTCAGSSYAARMSGSLLTALGLPCLVTTTLGEYEALALHLARDRGLFEGTRAALARQKTSSPLFDTDRFRRHLESAFIAMVERHRDGLPPATFRVPAQARSLRIFP